ncbi:MAG: response regulator, partial [Acidobacteriota bacterium]
APKVVGLNELFADFQSILERAVGEEASLRLDLARDLCQVRIDPGQFRQVIMNLIVNARDAMDRGGIVTIRTANIQLDSGNHHHWSDLPLGQYVLVSVADSGQGIPADLLEKIFEPFFTTKDESKGTGLGLSTVYGIVQQNGGSIAVESELGEGTLFSMLFPRVEEPSAKAVETVVARAHTPGQGTILVVEDEATVREMIVRSLRSFGYVVHSTGSPETALALFGENVDTFDLVISDVIMPELSGPAMVERMRCICPQLKVLFISGHPGDHLDDGADFIRKPFLPSDLAGRVREIIQAEG